MAAAGAPLWRQDCRTVAAARTARGASSTKPAAATPGAAQCAVAISPATSSTTAAKCAHAQPTDPKGAAALS